MYISLLFCLLSLSFLSCFRNCFLLDKVLNRSDRLVAFGETAAIIPVLGLSIIRRSPALWSSRFIHHRHRLSAPSLSGQGSPLFPLCFHDIDDTPAIRQLCSWLLCIIHRRSPAYSSISRYACHDALSRRSGHLQKPASYSWSTS